MRNSRLLEIATQFASYLYENGLLADVNEEYDLGLEQSELEDLGLEEDGNGERISII